MKPTKEEYRQRTRPNVEEYDLLVLGSGEAGKLISWTVAKQGMKTADVERKYVGGSCQGIACLPSKNVIHSDVLGGDISERSAGVIRAGGTLVTIAVADRFGLWRAFGEPNVGWGTFARFVAYTGKLNWFLPEAAVPALAIVATFAETLFGILLVLGWQTRRIALLSGVLLLLFAVTMTEALGIKAPLDFSVFSAAGGAFLLASCGEYPFSIDQLRRYSLSSTSSSKEK